MFTPMIKIEDKMVKNVQGAGGGGGTDYGAMMADLFNQMAQKQYEAAEKKEPAKANKTITQG